MKLTRRNLFRRSAEVAGVAAGVVVAAAIPAKVLEVFEPAVVPIRPEHGLSFFSTAHPLSSVRAWANRPTQNLDVDMIKAAHESLKNQLKHYGVRDKDIIQYIGPKPT